MTSKMNVRIPAEGGIELGAWLLCRKVLESGRPFRSLSRTASARGSGRNRVVSQASAQRCGKSSVAEAAIEIARTPDPLI